MMLVMRIELHSCRCTSGVSWITRLIHLPAMTIEAQNHRKSVYPIPFSELIIWQWKITMFNGKYIFKWLFFHYYIKANTSWGAVQVLNVHESSRYKIPKQQTKNISVWWIATWRLVLGFHFGMQPRASKNHPGAPANDGKSHWANPKPFVASLRSRHQNQYLQRKWIKQKGKWQM